MCAAKNKGGAKKQDDGRTLIVKNRRAFFNYEVLEKVEAGVVLTGSEVKSLRDGKLQLGDAYAAFKDGELYLLNAHISEYKQATYNNHEPTRVRKLLLHRRELRKLRRKLEEKGLTVVPLSVYFSPRGIVKVELGVCRGKKLHDKRHSIANREAKRDMARVRKHADR
jgi:SsrA-binding protein